MCSSRRVTVCGRMCVSSEPLAFVFIFLMVFLVFFLFEGVEDRALGDHPQNPKRG